MNSASNVGQRAAGEHDDLAPQAQPVVDQVPEPSGVGERGERCRPHVDDQRGAHPGQDHRHRQRQLDTQQHRRASSCPFRARPRSATCRPAAGRPSCCEARRITEYATSATSAGRNPMSQTSASITISAIDGTAWPMFASASTSGESRRAIGRVSRMPSGTAIITTSDGRGSRQLHVLPDRLADEIAVDAPPLDRVELERVEPHEQGERGEQQDRGRDQVPPEPQHARLASEWGRAALGPQGVGGRHAHRACTTSSAGTVPSGRRARSRAAACTWSTRSRIAPSSITPW